ncbi:MAG: hypothetical protein JW736_06600 [Deltaproteobacteria bacterium]|nr:hypothetical protein [Deltaproteobacteria bacterium]MBN2687061.1 hypothetical protein [Deltaproteobacteria bacterium]
MNVLTGDNLKSLIEKQEGLCVSLFMPTHRKGTETQQNQIRYRNLLRKAEEKLLDSDLRPQEIREFLRPAQELVGDVPFWQNQSDGLALYVSPFSFNYFRLPITFEELVIVTDRFHLKPIIPAATADMEFFILAVNQRDVRLIKGFRHSAEEVDLENAPESVADFFRSELLEKEFQYHTRRHPAAFQGAGGKTEDPKDDILRYFKQVDKGIKMILKGSHAPLVFAGVDYLYPIYKEANTYPHLIDKAISGSPEGLTLEELHEQAWPLVEPVFEKEKEEAIRLYKELSGTGRASSDINQIVPAACHGRIDTLFVAVGVQKWGWYNTSTDNVTVQKDATLNSTDLLDFAAIRTMLNGGTVYAVTPDEVPDATAMVAIFRY